MHPNLVKRLRVVAVALLAEAIRNLIEVNLQASRSVSRTIRLMREVADPVKHSRAAAIALHEEVVIRNLIEANLQVSRSVSRTIHLMRDEAVRVKHLRAAALAHHVEAIRNPTEENLQVSRSVNRTIHLKKEAADRVEHLKATAIVHHVEAIRNLIEENLQVSRSVSRTILLKKEAADPAEHSRATAIVHHAVATRNLTEEENLPADRFVNRMKSSVKEAAGQEVHFQNPVKSFSKALINLQSPDVTMMRLRVKVFLRAVETKHLLINHAERPHSKRDIPMTIPSARSKNQEQGVHLTKRMKDQKV